VTFLAPFFKLGQDGLIDVEYLGLAADFPEKDRLYLLEVSEVQNVDNVRLLRAHKKVVVW